MRDGNRHPPLPTSSRCRLQTDYPFFVGVDPSRIETLPVTRLVRSDLQSPTDTPRNTHPYEPSPLPSTHDSPPAPPRPFPKPLSEYPRTRPLPQEVCTTPHYHPKGPGGWGSVDSSEVTEGEDRTHSVRHRTVGSDSRLTHPQRRESSVTSGGKEVSFVLTDGIPRPRDSIQRKSRSGRDAEPVR